MKLGAWLRSLNLSWKLFKPFFTVAPLVSCLFPILAASLNCICLWCELVTRNDALLGLLACELHQRPSTLTLQLDDTECLLQYYYSPRERVSLLPRGGSYNWSFFTRKAFSDSLRQKEIKVNAWEIAEAAQAFTRRFHWGKVSVSLKRIKRDLPPPL